MKFYVISAISSLGNIRAFPYMFSVRQNNKNAAFLLSALAIVADAIAIAGLVVSRIDFIAFVGAALALIMGTYSLVKRWRRPLGWQIAGIICIMLASTVVLTLSAERLFSDKPEGVSPSVVESGTTNPDSPKTNTNKKSTSSHTAGTILFDDTVRLSPDLGTDLENGAAFGGKGKGATASIDLYLNERASYLDDHTSSAGFYLDVGDEADAYTRCNTWVLNGKKDPEYLLDMTDMAAGSQYCFLTSDGHTAWIKFNETRLTNGSSSDYVDMTIRVWY